MQNTLGQGRYTLLHTIGVGAFGKVRLAKDNTNGRQVAIKVIDKDHITALGAKKHLQKELQILAAINHPNLPKLYDVIAEGKLINIVMEVCAQREGPRSWSLLTCPRRQCVSL